MALENAESKAPGWLYQELVAMTFSALSLEALGNSFGEIFIDRWKDYESASPVAKIRILGDRLGVPIDFSVEPWAAVLWLVKFRNQVAHARPEKIVFDKIMTREDFEKSRTEYPKSNMELGISLEAAKRAVSAVEKIHEVFCAAVPLTELEGLLGDGFSGTASPHFEETKESNKSVETTKSVARPPRLT